MRQAFRSSPRRAARRVVLRRPALVVARADVRAQREEVLAPRRGALLRRPVEEGEAFNPPRAEYGSS